MSKVTFYGLSRSGKTCYLCAMSQALSQGIDFGGRTYFTASCNNPFQQAQLDSKFFEMEAGKWPKGTDTNSTYNFDLNYCMRLIQEIQILDYRGGLLNSVNTLDQEAQQAVMDGAVGSGVLLFFIGADTVIKAMNSQAEAMAQINFCNVLHATYRRSDPNWEKTPVMIVITKSDIFDSNHINRDKAKEWVVNRLRSFFGHGTNMTVGITMVSLGRNLNNTNKGELSGDLVVGGTSGNLHIPLLFSAYNFFTQEIERVTGELTDNHSSIGATRAALDHELGRSSFARFFSNNESTIRNTLDYYVQKASISEQKKNDLVSVFNKIGTFLKEGADIYINGEQI